MENFKLNASKAVEQFLAETECNDVSNINTMSNLCYSISSSYGKTFGEDVKKKLESQCVEMISEKKHKMGLTDCYMKRPNPPPIWNQTSHFFPDLLQKLKDPKKAYEQCCLEAQKSKYPNESLDKCKLDYLSIDSKDSKDSKENYLGNYDCDIDEDNNYSNNYSNNSSFLFWFIHILSILLIIVLIYYYMKCKKS